MPVALLLQVACWGPGALAAGRGGDPLAPWRQGVQVRPVLADAGRHTVHPYYLVSPESPDGRWVLLYTSATREGHAGDIRVVERATGRAKILAKDVTVEDIHRVACQQWVCGGRRIVFHDVRHGQWLVAAVDIESGQEQVLAKGRQLGWGQPGSNTVPLYGPHWDPGDHRDLELLNAETGEIRTVLAAAQVKTAYPAYIAKTYGDRPLSIFFPALSPDQTRVFFKMSSPAGGDFRSRQASLRRGLFAYDLKAKRFVYMRSSYGHPAWHPDSRRLLNVGGSRVTLADTDGGGQEQRNERLPRLPGAHPAASPDGRLFTADTRLEPFGGAKGHWGVVVGEVGGGDFVFVHKFDNSRGAASWRRAHPHPVFTADGKRLYFNVSAGRWTQLYVAERGAGGS